MLRRKWNWVVISVCYVFLSFVSEAQAKVPISRNYADVRAFMADLAARYPDNVAIFELGRSDHQNLPIEGLKIGKGSGRSLVVATHHGNEYGSTEVAKAVAESLAKEPLPDQVVYLVPVLNISGYDSGRRNETAGGRQYDANRDYPGPCGTEGPFRLKSTAALASFIDREKIVASITLHTFYPAVLYPWGISTHDLSTPYDGLFIELGNAAAVESGYKVGNSTELLYPADGTFEDYAFWKHGIWSLLMELGYSHWPTEAQIAEMKRVNVPGIRRMLQAAPRERAERHQFEGRCDVRLKSLDRHDE